MTRRKQLWDQFGQSESAPSIVSSLTARRVRDLSAAPNQSYRERRSTLWGLAYQSTTLFLVQFPQET